MDLFERLGRAAKQVRRVVDASRARMLAGDSTALVRLALEWYQENAFMLRLEIDSENKTIQIEVRLKGQAETLQVRASGYEIVGEAGRRRLVSPALTSPTGWLNVLLKTLRLGEKGVALPPEYEEMIELVL